MQNDPLGYIDGLNMFAYVGNNPVNWIDPMGLTLDCPASPPYEDPNWAEYEGNPDWFHCGFACFHETREGCPGDPKGECCYDDYGRLVDENHEYADCMGTPNEYEDMDFRHWFWPDSGGIWNCGLPGYSDSRRKDWDDLCDDYWSQWQDMKEQWEFCIAHPEECF